MQFHAIKNLFYLIKKKEVAFKQLHCDTIINNNHAFLICQGDIDSNKNIFILRDNDTIYKHPEWTNGFEIKDVNEDGFKDLVFHYLSNNPLEEIYLFDKTENKFIFIKDSDACPSTVKIKNTQYYYCYNTRGCSDLNWDSDLYYIKDFKIYKIGNITGIGCPQQEDEEDVIKNGIYIYKLRKDSIKDQAQHIPRESGFYDDKWEFIENYWTKNYKLFE